MGTGRGHKKPFHVLKQNEVQSAHTVKFRATAGKGTGPGQDTAASLHGVLLNLSHDSAFPAGGDNSRQRGRRWLEAGREADFLTLAMPRRRGINATSPDLICSRR